MITVSHLKDIGLSENESKVYLAMLELGPASVIDISKRADINRPTAYVQIESLKKKGLVSTQVQGKKQLFIAESPDHLEFVLDKELSEVERRKNEFQKTLPDLLNIYRSAGIHPQVRFFEGKEGIMRMQAIVLKSGAKELLSISNFDDVFEVFPRHVKEYTPKRVKNQIKSKLIYTSSDGAFMKGTDDAMLRESRFVPKDKMPFSGDITIFGDSIAIVALKGKISGIIIDHPDISNSFRNFFQFLWQFADNSE